MNLKEMIIWQKMLYNRGGAWISDGLLGGFTAAFIMTSNVFAILAVLAIRWLAGVIDYQLKIVQLENRLALEKQNPYMNKKLDGLNSQSSPAS